MAFPLVYYAIVQVSSEKAYYVYVSLGTFYSAAHRTGISYSMYVHV